MDYREITKILIRVAGVVIVIFAIVQIPGYFLNYYGLQQDSSSLFLGITVAPVALTAALGIVLWMFPGTVANKIVGGPEQLPSNQFKEVQIVAFSTLGMYVLVRAVGDSVFWASFIAAAANQEPGVTILTPDRYADLLATLAELVLGLFLILGSKGVVSLISRIRA